MAVKYTEENERIKRRYAQWLRNAQGRDGSTVDMALKAISRFEESTNSKNFKLFNLEHAIAFKTYLVKQKNARTGKPLSKSTIDSTLRGVRGFFHWLADQQGYKSRISHSDAEYFSNTLKDRRAAHAHRETSFPTMEQCDHAFRLMPEQDEYQSRDKAVFALLVLTGARVAALGSLKLKHVDLVQGTIFQDAREVKTKHAKTFTSAFLPVDPMYAEYFTNWVTYLKGEKLFGNDDALFPKIEMAIAPSGGGFERAGLSRQSYAGTGFVREIMSTAFNNAGLPKFGPHSIRKILTVYGVDRYGDNPQKFKAWSLNMGHESIATTLKSYLPMSESDQIRTLQKMREDEHA